VNETKIYDIHGNEVAWAKQVEYQMPKLDKYQNPIPGEYSSGTYKKTIYDPTKMLNTEYCNRGIEAANNALAKETSGVLPHTWTGVDSKGVTWMGYYENGTVTSFFPTN
jgi:hypothetical protein